MSRERDVELGLQRLKRTLKEAGLWQTMPVSPEALASTQPFAIDTLSLQQWLQFIYLPKLQGMLDQGQPLPTRVSVAPMAQEMFGDDLPELVEAITHLDGLLSGPR
ncbi:YqcC family protein [Ferrimonas sediminicola]|uniref:YqcC family protein n=1 Tax=Ferrimonas sediminicola TaxID=2569538 RepID=A0A4U1BES5_9GAMM|nr:YqcC family protein [Ferrimonas sediminicola]TKB49734.1 YqcC family protein [Ferrimonas sediminicola]